MFRSKLMVFSLSLLAVISQFAFCAGWPQFRGPDGQGISTAKNLPVTWSDTQNIAWKTKMPGYGSSSPISLDGKLYVTCYSGFGDGFKGGKMEDLRLHLLCIDSKNGNILWNEPLKPELPEAKRVRDHGYTAATPATDGKHIYVFYGRSGVYKYDLKGTVIWQQSVGTKTHGWGSGTSPVLYKNLVIVNASVESGELIAINKDTGKIAWNAGGMRESWNTPHLVKTADGKVELAVSVKGLVLGFDPATGKKLWSCDGIPDYICPSIISDKGILYAIGGRSSKTLAIKAGGRGDVTKTHKLWQADVGANVSSPILHNGHLYWVSDRNKVAYCISAADGSVKYAEDFKIQPYASALLADGKVYIVTRNNGTVVLAAEPKYKELARNEMSDKSTFNASPIVSDGALILRSDEYLYSIRK